MFVVKLANFREENYKSTEDFSITHHWTTNLSIAQTKLHEIRNILVRLNETNIPVVMNVQALEVGLEVQEYPQKSQNPAELLHISNDIYLVLLNFLYSSNGTLRKLNKNGYLYFFLSGFRDQIACSLLGGFSKPRTAAIQSLDSVLI